MAIILGIDPGSRITGYGVISSAGSKLTYIDCGCIRTENQALPLRLHQIFVEIGEVIQRHCPQEAAVEEVFMGKNAASALKLGHARGSAIIACLDQELSVEEYAARAIKKAIVGRGAAEKQQVQHMVKALLGISEPIQEDAADALAVAICHANTQMGLIKMAGSKSFSKKRLRP